jgi:uncharacterized protein (TIRG00374 family)
MSSVGKNKTRRIKPFLLLRMLGVILFIYILSTVDLGQLWSNIRNIRMDYLLYGIAFQLLLLIVKGLRWHELNSGSRSSKEVYRSMGEFLESYAIGVITPGRLGELMKAGHAREKNQMLETGIRILIERGLDIGFFILIAGIAMIAAYTHLIHVWVGYITLITGSMIFMIAVFLMRSPLLTQLVQRILNILPMIGRSFQLSFRSVQGRTMFSIVVLSLVSNISAFLSCYMLAVGLGLELSFLFISGGIAMAGLLNMLPITIMGLGTREGTFLILFRPIAEPLILAFSGLVFLVAQVGGGIMALLMGYFFLYLKRK